MYIILGFLFKKVCTKTISKTSRRKYLTMDHQHKGLAISSKLEIKKKRCKIRCLKQHFWGESLNSTSAIQLCPPTDAFTSATTKIWASILTSGTYPIVPRMVYHRYPILPDIKSSCPRAHI